MHFSEEARSAFQQVASVIQAMEAAHPVWAVAAVLIFAALSAMLAFVSAAVIAPFMVATWGAPLACFLLWVGWLLGGALAYTVGRTAGRPAIVRLLSPEHLARYEEFVSSRAPFGLVLLFQLALPSEVPGYLLGLARYPFGLYFLSLSLGELPYAVGTIYLGAGVMDGRLAQAAGVGLAVALLSAWAYRTLHKK
ncbi:MAG TPA: VTT domain-containing protein, partial [Vicinamibacterales bacterium]